MKKENNIVYHPEDDILCSTCGKPNKISSKKPYKYGYTLELNDNVLIDLDRKGNVIGIEILNASEALGLSKENLAKRFKIIREPIRKFKQNN
jgi:uncharacterized protein YuzE